MTAIPKHFHSLEKVTQFQFSIMYISDLPTWSTLESNSLNYKSLLKSHTKTNVFFFHLSDSHYTSKLTMIYCNYWHMIFRYWKQDPEYLQYIRHYFYYIYSRTQNNGCQIVKFLMNKPSNIQYNLNLQYSYISWIYTSTCWEVPRWKIKTVKTKSKQK